MVPGRETGVVRTDPSQEKVDALDMAMPHVDLFERDSDRCRPSFALQVTRVDSP
jgi:hypothetical protein